MLQTSDKSLMEIAHPRASAILILPLVAKCRKTSWESKLWLKLPDYTRSYPGEGEAWFIFGLPGQVVPGTQKGFQESLLNWSNWARWIAHKNRGAASLPTGGVLRVGQGQALHKRKQSLRVPAGLLGKDIIILLWPTSFGFPLKMT